MPQAPHPNGHPKVGYGRSAWPRLSETFIQNEVMAIERLGARLQIFTIKEAEGEAAQASAAGLQVPVTCLSIQHHRKLIGLASIRLFLDDRCAVVQPYSGHCA